MAERFVRIDKRYATDGSPMTASDYVYDVDGREVFVEVHATVIHEWNAPGSEVKQVSEQQIQQAITVLIKEERGAGWSPRESNRLVLDEFRVRPIAERLGWTPR